MKLYVCWNTVDFPKGHPCARAHRALVDAGYEPEVERGYGWAKLPAVFNFSPVRRKARSISGSDELPVLELADGTLIQGSQKIKDWARANPR